MARYKCVCSYDGYDYMGFQIQNALPTIELEITLAFKKLLGIDVKIYPSGRTDRYVHAVGQVFHVDLDQNIPPIGLLKGLNSYLPSSIHIRDVSLVSEDFHSRFSAISKEYRYYINIKEYNPIHARYMPYIYGLNIPLMQQGLKLLEGTHDFKGFASSSIDPRKSTIKTIYEASLNVLDGYLEFKFIGSSFLKYQIRRMMGLILEIGQEKEPIDKILEVLEKKDPGISHRVADGCGLYLVKVNYEGDINEKK